MYMYVIYIYICTYTHIYRALALIEIIFNLKSLRSSKLYPGSRGAKGPAKHSFFITLGRAWAGQEVVRCTWGLFKMTRIMEGSCFGTVDDRNPA